jgi:hypothetical protein
LQIGELVGIQFGRPAAASSLLQTRQAFLVELLNPVGHGARRIAQQLSHLAAVHALRYQ